ncbi:DUF423 domain-containing protein [Cyclobacterium jeungdonense]|uniref:DUF423 domain-containing protein n=1 Tax=Cyclobacterium jeungdonense TaxID=708087 RepID=A0ABT8C1W9_9BACT|nr:DUF423 domain-containing protein [Cyclobacterium jeungdonense]MDN3686769.1 DUF423 domain-containing protein [Cyclobacterium jeungdonense]
MNAKIMLQLAAIFGALAVIFGAFGAHALEALLVKTGRLDTYETAVNYHFYYSLALLMVGILYQQNPTMTGLKLSAWFFLGGIIVFSGSLYLLCLSQVTWLGAITPLGGISFILGWAWIFVSFRKGNQ